MFRTIYHDVDNAKERNPDLWTHCLMGSLIWPRHATGRWRSSDRIIIIMVIYPTLDIVEYVDFPDRFCDGLCNLCDWIQMYIVYSNIYH